MGPRGNVRGIYLNARAAGSAETRRRLIELADDSAINAFVIDVKEAGEVSFPTRVPLANRIGAGRSRIEDVAALLEELGSHGIRPIARVNVFRDPILAEAHPEWAVRSVDGATWRDTSGLAWTDPFNGRVWNYNLEVAREALELGFAEVQLDYVRFPATPRDGILQSTSSARLERAGVIASFVEVARNQLGDLGPVTAAVFGIATRAEGATAIGQAWEKLISVADALHPMVYPSHYAPGTFGFDNPNARPYDTVRKALDHAVRRTPAGRGAELIQPWLQGFTLGSPAYGVTEIRDQIRAVHDAGLSGWFLWNSRSRYTVEALR
jgi:hypothetical protein